jgi:hypothetical protein
MSIPSAKATLAQAITDYVLELYDPFSPLSFEEIEEAVYEIIDDYVVEYD